MQHEKGTYILSSDETQDRKKAWLECLPSNLSDLFYYSQEDGDLERVSTYTLKITKQDHSILQSEYGLLSLQYISIDMGCKLTSTGKKTFAPTFAMHFKDKFPIVFDLQLQEKSEPTLPIADKGISKAESKGDQLTEITKSIGELFAQKWHELTDLEIGHAFSGVTFGKLPTRVDTQQEGEEKMRRVRSYSFPREDAKRIFTYILQNETPTVNVMLGAGLVVRVDHPFNFRPIIFTGLTDQWVDDKVGTYFERAKPCPPFCGG